VILILQVTLFYPQISFSSSPQNNFEVFLFPANLLHAKETFHTAIYKAAKHCPSIFVIPSDELKLVEPYVTTPP